MCFEQTVDQCGGIDILVSNAAVNPFFGNIMDSTEDVWDKVHTELSPFFDFNTGSFRGSVQRWMFLCFFVDPERECKRLLPHDQVGDASYGKEGVSLLHVTVFVTNGLSKI